MVNAIIKAQVLNTQTGCMEEWKTQRRGETGRVEWKFIMFNKTNEYTGTVEPLTIYNLFSQQTMHCGDSNYQSLAY
mgnify:CR=1 FL=1